MKTWHVILLAASIIVATLGAAFMLGSFNRYSVIQADAGQVAHPNYLAAWKLDRLTGEMNAVVLIGGNVLNIRESKKLTPEEQERFASLSARVPASGGWLTPLYAVTPPPPPPRTPGTMTTEEVFGGKKK